MSSRRLQEVGQAKGNKDEATQASHMPSGRSTRKRRLKDIAAVDGGVWAKANGSMLQFALDSIFKSKVLKDI